MIPKSTGDFGMLSVAESMGGYLVSMAGPHGNAPLLSDWITIRYGLLPQLRPLPVFISLRSTSQLWAVRAAKQQPAKWL